MSTSWLAHSEQTPAFRHNTIGIFSRHGRQEPGSWCRRTCIVNAVSCAPGEPGRLSISHRSRSASPRALVYQRVSDTRLTRDCRGGIVSAPCRNQVGSPSTSANPWPRRRCRSDGKARSVAVTDLVQMVAWPQRTHPVPAVSGMGCGFCGSSRSRMALSAWI